jgi:nucleotide-binding universal stress UspA family protein
MTDSTAIHIREILFASDFSPHSDHAFDAALTLAQHFGARLHLLHVVHHPHEQEAARARFDAFAEERVAGVEFTLAIARGSPASQIVKHAEREKVDLIVMGTHGRTGLAHVARGSVAETVVRHAPCLVLTIGRAAELRVDVAEPSAEGRGVHSTPGRRAHLCLVCARPSEDLVCDACKSRIRAEAIYLRAQDDKAVR